MEIELRQTVKPKPPLSSLAAGSVFIRVEKGLHDTEPRTYMVCRRHSLDDAYDATVPVVCLKTGLRVDLPAHCSVIPVKAKLCLEAAIG